MRCSTRRAMAGAPADGNPAATQLGSRLSFLLLFIGLLLYSQALFLAGIVLFSLTTFFQLVTLPVEFNASHRALEALESQAILWDDELVGARRVLQGGCHDLCGGAFDVGPAAIAFPPLFAGRNNREQGGGRR